MGAGRLVAGFAGFAAFEPAGIHIFPATEEAAKRSDLELGWRVVPEGEVSHIWYPGRVVRLRRRNPNYLYTTVTAHKNNGNQDDW
jgi:hypothetical protein